MTWVMWVTLLSGQAIYAGEYQTWHRCSRAIEMQQRYWVGKHAADKMECRLSTVTPLKGRDNF